jgi:hypothetical protein
MGARHRIPSDPAIFRLEFPSEVRQWSLPELDTPVKSMETCIKKIFVFIGEKP